MPLRKFWSDISVSKKIYFVVGVMGLLIAIELISLRFALHTLSSVRAFVGGEALWSKAQKTAVLNLEKYAHTRDERYFEAYLNYLEVPMGDRQARMELMKPEPDIAVIYEGFLKGQIDYNDIDGLIKLVRRFHNVPHLKRALDIWTEGDRLLSELTKEADNLHQLIKTNQTQEKISASMERIEKIDSELTVLEANFSYALGEGSRWLENLLLSIMFMAVLTVECTGVYLTISFSRNLTRDLKELSDTTAEIGRGNFTKQIPVRSKDEIGQLAVALNSMTQKLKNTIGEQQQAERASEVKSLFLASMSHEIRTPLGAILGFAELLKDHNLTPVERDQYLDIILKTGSNLSKILHDILDISKVEAGQIEIEKTRFSLPNLLSEIRQVLDIKCSEKKVDLSFAIGNDVPDFIFTDVFRLRQILMNLINNAIKFTDQGEIQVTTRVRGKDLVFTVEDTGIGLNREDQEKLFKAFSQGHQGSTRKNEGTGLGLILSRRLAALLGGDVELIRSQAGQGSVFEARILLESTPANFSENKQPLRNQNEEKLEGKSILVVDDASENRFLMEKLLTKRGAAVVQAVNGAEGVEKALAQNFDIVLMDIQMPVMDGYTAIETLRRQNYDRPVIALTAHAMKGDRIKCLQAGFNDYLTKPLQIPELMKVIYNNLA